MPWSGVKFSKTNEVEVVPTCWLNKEKNKCYYPSVDNDSLIKKCIRTETAPEEEWTDYEVEIMTHEDFSSLKIASMKASKACFISDLDDSSHLSLPGKRQRRKKGAPGLPIKG